MKIDKFISRIERISSIFFRFFESSRRVFEIEQFRRTIFAVDQSRRIFEIESRRASKFSIDIAETFFFLKFASFEHFRNSSSQICEKQMKMKKN